VYVQLTFRFVYFFLFASVGLAVGAAAFALQRSQDVSGRISGDKHPKAKDDGRYFTPRAHVVVLRTKRELYSSGTVVD
jgi:hypothetical protein